MLRLRPAHHGATLHTAKHRRTARQPTLFANPILPSPWLRQRCPSPCSPAIAISIAITCPRRVQLTIPLLRRLTEEVLHEAIDARTESLVALRELGPPDLVHLVKVPLRSGAKQVGVRRAPVLAARG